MFETLNYSLASSIHERLSIRLDQFETLIYENQKNETAVIENPSETQILQTKVSFLEDNIREKFVVKFLETLELLQYTLTDINDIKEQEQAERLENEPEFLGIRDLMLVHTMLKIVITWGVYPCLLSGVGVPLSRRTRSGYIQNELLEGLTTEEEKIKSKALPYSLYNQLYKFVESLTNIMFSKSSKPRMYTSSILFSKYLADIYSALLQLAYGPLPSMQTITMPPQNNDKNTIISEKATFNWSEGEIRRMHHESIGMFRKVFESADSFQSLEALTMLLGSSPLHSSPKWFKNICG